MADEHSTIIDGGHQGLRLVDMYNFILPQEELINTPSRLDGVSAEAETELRYYGCEIIQESGILLGLSQVVCSRAQVLLHHFYFRKSFKRIDVKAVSMACLFLACKLEEQYKKLRFILLVFHRVFQRRDNEPLTALGVGSREYFEMKDDIINTERLVLKELGFIMHTEHPHKFLLFFCKMLATDHDSSEFHAFTQTAWNILNDSLRTTLCCRFEPATIACGAIYLSARAVGRSLPLSPPWWHLFSTSTEDLVEVVKTISALYRKHSSADNKAKYMDILETDDATAEDTEARATDGVDTPVDGKGGHGSKDDKDSKGHSRRRDRSNSSERRRRRAAAGTSRRDRDRDRSRSRDRDRDRDRRTYGSSLVHDRRRDPTPSGRYSNGSSSKRPRDRDWRDVPPSQKDSSRDDREKMDKPNEKVDRDREGDKGTKDGDRNKEDKTERYKDDRSKDKTDSKKSDRSKDDKGDRYKDDKGDRYKDDKGDPHKDAKKSDRHKEDRDNKDRSERDRSSKPAKTAVSDKDAKESGGRKDRRDDSKDVVSKSNSTSKTRDSDRNNRDTRDRETTNREKERKDRRDGDAKDRRSSNLDDEEKERKDRRDDAKDRRSSNLDDDEKESKRTTTTARGRTYRQTVVNVDSDVESVEGSVHDGEVIPKKDRPRVRDRGDDELADDTDPDRGSKRSRK